MHINMVDYDARKVIAYLNQGVVARLIHPIPYAAPSTGGFIGNPDKTARAQEASGIGRFSFGYFSLPAQRKVSRPWVREPTLKTTALATHYRVHPSTSSGRTVF